MHLRTNFESLMAWVHTDAFQPPLTFIDQRKFCTADGVSIVFSCDENPVRVVVPMLPNFRNIIVALPNPFAEFGNVRVVTRDGGTTNNLRG